MKNEKRRREEMLVIASLLSYFFDKLVSHGETSVTIW